MLGEDFIFDGISSSLFGVKMIRIGSSGFLDEPLMGSANITEAEHPNSFKPYMQKITRSPIEFTRQIALLKADGTPKAWSDTDRRAIVKWLFHNEYKSLIFSDKPDVVFHVIATSNLTLNTMSNKGYIDVVFRTDSPYAWKIPQQLILTSGTSFGATGTVNIDQNIVVERIYPRILLERVSGVTSAATVQVWTSNLPASQVIGVSNSLIPGVTNILMDCKHKSITDYATKKSIYRYKGATGFEFPSFVKGTNTVYTPKGWKATINFEEPIIY